MTDKDNLSTGKPSTGATENKGFQPSRTTSGGSGVQGGYQGPTSESAPANPPSGGTSGGKK